MVSHKKQAWVLLSCEGAAHKHGPTLFGCEAILWEHIKIGARGKDTVGREGKVLKVTSKTGVGVNVQNPSTLGRDVRTAMD